MWAVAITAILILNIQKIYSLNDINDEEVPKIFVMDDFKSCKEQGKVFCRIHFKLMPLNRTSRIWKTVESTKSNPNCFNKDQVYRFRCFEKGIEEPGGNISRTAVDKENLVLKKFGLEASAEVISCNNYSRNIEVTGFDYFVLCTILAHLFVIISATVLDIMLDNSKANQKNIMFKNKIIVYCIKSMSMRSSWRILNKTSSENNLGLKCMEGLRVFAMMYVITGHTVLNFLFSYVEDTTYLENFYMTLYKKIYLNIGLHVVQIYFLISIWLLTIQIYQHVEKKKKVTLGYIIKNIIVRYLRLAPSLAYIILWETSNWTQIMARGPPYERVEMDYNACQKNWWVTLLFVHNFLRQSDMCNLGTWSLATDFQMYIVTLIALYFKFNYGFTDILFWSISAISWMIHAVGMFTYNCGVMYDFNPENDKVENSVGSYTLVVQYSSWYANFATSGIAMIFAGICYKYRNHKLPNTSKNFWLWILLFLGLPALAAYLSLFKYSRLTGAILGASLKPIFATGIAVGILGMSLGLGGALKHLCESRFVQLLAKLNYSIYLIHFGVVFGSNVSLENLVEVSDIIVITKMAYNVIISIVVGLIFYLVIEQPISTLLGTIMKRQKTE